MKNELVSVIIPTYNRVSYLQIAIDSVLNQTYSNLELIIIDDGSTDNTREVIQRKYGERVIYIWQENQGESVARNRGISMARGEYIAFLDSDDYWVSNKLETQVAYLSVKGRAGVACVFSTVWLVDESGRKIEENPKGNIKSKKDISFESLLTKNVILVPPSNVLVRTSCLQETGGFDPSIQYGEDKDLLLRLRAKWDFGYIDVPLIFQRQHSSNQSTSILEKSIDKVFFDRIKVVRKNLILNDNVDKKVADGAIENLLLSAASWCFYYEKWEKGSQYLLQVNEKDRSVIFSVLPEKIAYKEAVKFFESATFSAHNVNAFINSFLFNLAENWDESLGAVPFDRIKGCFLQEVVLRKRKIARFSLQYLLVLLLKYNPHIINYKSFVDLLNLDL